jgi:hypothetical protein
MEKWMGRIKHPRRKKIIFGARWDNHSHQKKCGLKRILNRDMSHLADQPISSAFPQSVNPQKILFNIKAFAFLRASGLF